MIREGPGNIFFILPNMAKVLGGLPFLDMAQSGQDRYNVSGRSFQPD